MQAIEERHEPSKQCQHILARRGHHVEEIWASKGLPADGTAPACSPGPPSFGADLVVSRRHSALTTTSPAHLSPASMQRMASTATFSL